ncbi:MAG TPA: zinc ribbon domain-containing protein, partial [Candidatus Acidoferrum sp.]|nr:zinc ribbon domain-containing protein [Candidatus Acidoferrum sp.]
ILGLVFYLCYGYGWFALLRGLMRFRRYFLIAKERENARFDPDFRCPSCNSKVLSDWRHCKECGGKLSALPLPKPKIKIPPPAELDKPSPIRLERFAASARREYEGEINRISSAVGFRVAKESDVVEFQQFPQRFLVGPEVLVDAYSEGDTYTSPEIIGLGRSIAIAEEKYIMESLLKGIGNRAVLDAFTGEGLANEVRRFNLRPDVVFVPHVYMVPLMMAQLKGIKLTRKGSDEFISIGDIGPLPIVWSLAYLQFKEVIFLERTFGEWLVKPDENGNRLWVKMAAERKEGKFDVTVKSVAGYTVKNPTNGLAVAIHPSSE